MVHTSSRAALCGAAILVCSQAARSSTVDVIYSRSNGPTSFVPGARDAAGNPVQVKFPATGEFFLSPDGSTWLYRTTSSTQYQFLLKGNGLVSNVLLQKGQVFPGAEGTEVVNFPSGLKNNPFNANNDFAFSIRVTNNPDPFKLKILRYTGVVGEVRFQTGEAYIGAAGTPHLGAELDSIHLRNDGVIGWRDRTSGIPNLPITAYDAVRHLQANADTVTRIDGSGQANIIDIGVGFADFQTSLDGSHVLLRIKADVDATSNDPWAVVWDGQIVAQVGQPLPGSPSITPTTIDGISLAPNNDWYMRGRYSGGSFATRNGMVIAKTGDAVGAHTWDAPFNYGANPINSFFAVTGNINGDWVIVGRMLRSDGATWLRDAVVMNGQIVLCEGDPAPVDVDNDGVLDTAYIGRGAQAPIYETAFVSAGNTYVGLAPDKTVYVMATLRDVTGSDIAPPQTGAGTALIRINPPAPPCGTSDYNGDGDFGTDQDIEAFFACLGGTCCATCYPGGSDFNGDGDYGTDQDIESFFRVLGGGPC